MSDTARVILDFPEAARRAFTQPAAVLTTSELSKVRDVLRAAETAAARGSYAVGFVSYEAAPAFDAALRVVPGPRLPFAWFAIFDQFADLSSDAARTGEIIDWALPDARDYSAAIERIREEIAAGRTYQVNLTTRLEAEFRGQPFAYYETLRRAQGSGYHAFIDTPEFAIVSASPELFFQIEDRRIRTRPMKGTRARGRFTAEDDRNARALADSEKDRAENLMIVDLLRNDLGRVAETGSVAVTSLFDVERYRTVHQLTSTIEARLAHGVTLTDVFAALFPCGSVTGAPKISTMQLIAELERIPRDVYCGALGVIEPGGTAIFNVPIRTVWIDKPAGRAFYGTGAGITYDSDARSEYAEIVAKAGVLVEHWPDFELLETMRIEGGSIMRLERHLARLLDSARYFDFAIDEAAIHSVLADVNASRTARLRLLVDSNGGVRVELHEFDVVDQPNVGIATAPVQSSDRFLFHKTTQRAAYERHVDGCWDVLLWNERGEITEFTRGNVVLEIAGELLTPARECGLLAGTFRAELLERGLIRATVLPLRELERASRVWLINSVREWVQVDVRAIAESLDAVYDAQRVLQEIMTGTLVETEAEADAARHN
ncbi:MAG: aminodeoxychorismate synthase component I [Gemmatimonadota bacterium]